MRTAGLGHRLAAAISIDERRGECALMLIRTVAHRRGSSRMDAPINNSSNHRRRFGGRTAISDLTTFAHAGVPRTAIPPPAAAPATHADALVDDITVDALTA